MRNRWSNESSFSAILVFFLISIEFSQSVWTSFKLNAMRDMNGTTSVVYYNLKTKRISRTTYRFTGTVSINDDLKNYEIEVKLLYSTNGNDDYVLTPIRIKREPACDACNREYRHFLMKALSTATDLPNSNATDICPLFEKKTYTIKDCRYETYAIPRWWKPGWYRIQLLIFDLDGIQASGGEVDIQLQ